MYAILSHGGRQYRVTAGDRLVVDRLEAEVGSVIALAPVLLTAGDGETNLGDALDGVRVAATVVSHTRGPKLRIFKYKAKKRYRRAAGHRSDLTEVRVMSILAKGDELPTGTAEAARPRNRPKPSVRRARGVRKVAGTTTETKRPAASRPGAIKRAAKAAPKPPSTRAATRDEETDNGA